MKRIVFCALISLGTIGLYAEDLEFLFTSTALYNGSSSLSGASAYTMPSGDSSYVGWVWFPYGFTLDANSTSSFNIIGPVDGTIILNDGTLTLTGDMLLGRKAIISGDGNVNGNGYALVLHDQLALQSTLTFVGNTIINGQQNIIELGSQAKFWISNNTTVTLQNLVLKDIAPSSIVMEGTGSSLVLNNVDLWLDGDYSFTQGSIYFYNDVSLNGSAHTFSYQSGQQSYVTKQSMFTIDHGVTFRYDPSIANRNLIVMEDDTAHLYLNGCTLSSTPTGLMLTKGTVMFDGLITLSADGQTVSEAIAFGDASGSDLTTITIPGANIQVYGYIDVN